ncbi:MAG TPA: glycosyl hydrolase, partial [Polyangiaceae bacterium]
NWINQNTGKYPAILGGDYLYPSGTTSRAQAYWDAGGITMIRYHMGAPPNSDTYENSMGTANIASVLTEGSAANVSFKSKLDYAARELQTLENANVAVLWAPFHEAQPNGWFWWSKGTGAEFVQLWTYMYNYFTTTKGLNNLVWLMPFSGSPNASFYPGRNYVDIAGPDTYATNQPFTSMFTTTRTIVGTTIPIPLHENGLLPNPNDMFNNNAAPWVLFNTWAGYQISNNSLSHVQSVYANTRTVTRDEVPNLR